MINMLDVDDLSDAKGLLDWILPKSIFARVAVVLILVGIIGYVLFGFGAIDPLSIQGYDFAMQHSIDANGVEMFSDYDSGDKVIIVDKVVRMQYSFDEEGATSIWVESIGNGNVIRFVCDSNYMNDFGIGDSIVLKLEIVDEGASEGFLCEAGGRLSTTTEYAFIGLILFGTAIGGFGFTRARIQPSVAQDDWGVPAPAMAPAPVAPPPAMVPPGLPPQPQNPPSMAAIPSAPPVAPPPAAPSNMTITVPPGVVPGQVLTVTMPNGQVVNVQVPPGCEPGSQFTISVTQ